MSRQNPGYMVLVVAILGVGFCAMGAIGLVLLQIARAL